MFAQCLPTLLPMLANTRALGQALGTAPTQGGCRAWPAHRHRHRRRTVPPTARSKGNAARPKLRGARATLPERREKERTAATEQPKDAPEVSRGRPRRITTWLPDVPASPCPKQ